jgi:hypothetical protein
MEEIGGFYILWQDAEGNILGNEWLDKGSYRGALRSVGLRLYQSEHTCPPNVGGFFVMSAENFQNFQGLDSTDKRVQQMHVDKIAAEMDSKYGPPPPGFGSDE